MATTKLWVEYQTPAKRFGPTERFLQCMAVMTWLMIILALVPSSLLLIIAATNFWWSKYVLLVYFSWVFYDLSSAYNGGWNMTMFEFAFKKLSFWDRYKDYFDACLVKEEELDPNRNYILGFHPHGVYCLSVMTNLWLIGSRKEPFPNHRVRASTLPINFYIPFWREFLLACGSTTCAKISLIEALKKPNTALLIAIGGAEEFKYMEEHTLDLVIQKRKGFAKLALETGADLVPILGFGENELFSRIKGPIFEKLNQITEQLGRFSPPLFVGRSWSWMPKRSRLVTVVGKPIHVEKVDKPSNEQILKLHTLYLEKLQELYEKYKDVYHKDRIRDLAFVK